MPECPVLIRGAHSADTDHLARLWFDGWQDAHDGLLPTELARHRTLPSFHARIYSALGDIRVADRNGGPIGFSLVCNDELNQLYVAASARGTGAAAALTADALTRVIEAGYRCAWLACAIGNERATRFYEKVGWRNVGIMTSHLDTPDGTVSFDVWR